MKNMLETLLGILFYLAVMYAQFFGLYHGITKHNWALTVFLPPAAWYYSIEYWWHTNDEEVRIDMKNCTYFLENYETRNTPSFNEEMSNFHNRYKSYTSDEKLLIKSFIKDCIKYRESQYYDVDESLNEYLNTHILKLIESDNTKKSEKEFSKYEVGKQIIEEEKKYNNEALQLAQDNLSNIPEDELDSFKINLQKLNLLKITQMKLSYKEMFREEYN